MTAVKMQLHGEEVERERVLEEACPRMTRIIEESACGSSLLPSVLSRTKDMTGLLRSSNWRAEGRKIAMLQADTETSWTMDSTAVKFAAHEAGTRLGKLI